MSYFTRHLADDVRLCRRTTIGALLGLAAVLALAWSYGSLYGTDGLPMATYLTRATLTLGGAFVVAGILSGFAIHLMRERRGGTGD
ncbi:hypothetical protein [Tautonia plasticadhaerens]|uniref:Uncharacterized protein n=1 Tax=Tautonia plasticadhaerens TaxID=2527974 RepID=A0A518H117_9BACT|nr:hypothetical protein [Tautonia plasticadhaerens]QDV34503.1 hypothetical protein ElP_23920 [Tautonia plasticadhaerens]